MKMMKILRESYQDVEVFLRSTDLINQIVEEFGRDSLRNSELATDICSFVVDQVSQQFDTEITFENVVVCKVIGEDIDFVDQMHPVVVFNGFYYDYTAMIYSTSFNNLIQIAALPVVQKIINSDEQITDKLSTIKGYTLLGY